MHPILFLAHRLPYPPTKGDKVRSFHLLQYLAARYRVFLGTFIDNATDARYVEHVREYCANLNVQRIRPRLARARSFTALATGEPLSVAYYRSPALAEWARHVIKAENINSAVVFSSPMFQFVAGLDRLHVIADLVDVDSFKWTEYAKTARVPFSWLYRSEGKRLLAYERSIAKRSMMVTFVTDAEAELFRRLAPECADHVATIENGVDSSYFDPLASTPSPYPAGELPIVFTGAMDYKPNVVAACWFAQRVLPIIRHRSRKARFYIVGARPALAVRAIASEAVTVTGTVPDVRPFLQHAAVAVAPLLIARGVQNKVLEAMAMARAIVISPDAATGIDGTAGREFEIAGTATEFADKVTALLTDSARAAALGNAARARVVARYGWEANLSRIDVYLPPRNEPAVEGGELHRVLNPAGAVGAGSTPRPPWERSRAFPTSP